MKKILVFIYLILGLLSFSPAYAAGPYTQSQIKNRLVNLHMNPDLAIEIAALLADGQTVIDNNTYIKARNAANSANIDVLKVDASDRTVLSSSTGFILYADADGNRSLAYDASSDTALALTFGDGGTTASQALAITASTSDADDDAALCLGAGGACGVTTRGAFINMYGNEVASVGGTLTLKTGGVSGADMTFAVDDDFIVEVTAGTDALVIDAATGIGTFANNIVSTAGNIVATNGNFDISTGGGKLRYQEAVAGSACMGTATANGTTAVTISTTCASTGSRIFLTRSSAPSGTADCWWDTLVNGTSFNLDCNGAETGTFNWFIVGEVP